MHICAGTQRRNKKEQPSVPVMQGQEIEEGTGKASTSECIMGIHVVDHLPY